MALDMATLGKTQHAALTGVDAHVTIGNFPGVLVLTDVDGHITVDGSAADTTCFPIKANERVAVVVEGKNPASAVGLGEVHFVKATGAADGNIWITEAC
jgi:hypothetical protein